MGGKIFEILKKLFSKKNFQEKHFFQKKKEKCFFFQNIKFLCIGVKKHFLPKNYFCQKQSVRFQNGVFWFFPAGAITFRTPPTRCHSFPISFTNRSVTSLTKSLFKDQRNYPSCKTLEKGS